MTLARRKAKWRAPPEEIEEHDLLTGEEMKLLQSVAATLNYLAKDKLGLLNSVEELMREMASPRAKDLIALKREDRYTFTYLRKACRYLWTPSDSNIEVASQTLPDVLRRRKSTVGGVVLWSGQFVKAWAKTKAKGVRALSSGESELVAIVRAATESLGLQSILSDFDLCSHVAIKSDATAAIGTVHRLGFGKVRHFAVGELRFSITFVRRKFESP